MNELESIDRFIKQTWWVKIRRFIARIFSGREEIYGIDRKEQEWHKNRREAQIRMGHIFGYCVTNNCNLGFPQLTGVVVVTVGSGNLDPNEINCKDKEPDD